MADLNQAIIAFKQAVGEQWKNSIVVTVTELGRTAAENGTTGTDHGVGFCCFLAGGLVNEAKVYADWGGLQKAHLFEERDLPITIDIAAVYALVLERVSGLSAGQIQDSVLEHMRSTHLKGLLGLGYIQSATRGL